MARQPNHTSYYFCGWYSKSNGRYFVTAPAGTYTLNLKPKTGLSFPTYTENNFIVNGDTTKNIILGSSSTTQTPTRSSNLTLTVQAKSFEVGSTLTVNGKLSDQNGNTLTDKTVILSYSVGNSGIWTPVGSGKTDSTGTYRIEWLVPASGTFDLKVEWTGNADYAKTSSTTTLAFTTQHSN